MQLLIFSIVIKINTNHYLPITKTLLCILTTTKKVRYLINNWRCLLYSNKITLRLWIHQQHLITFTNISMFKWMGQLVLSKNKKRKSRLAIISRMYNSNSHIWRRTHLNNQPLKAIIQIVIQSRINLMIVKSKKMHNRIIKQVNKNNWQDS